MPHVYIHVTSSDGAIESHDGEGITLDGIGAIRALAIETLIEFARDKPRPGRSRTIEVRVDDAAGDLLYGDAIRVSGGPVLGSDDAAVGRAIRAMNRTRP